MHHARQPSVVKLGQIPFQRQPAGFVGPVQQAKEQFDGAFDMDGSKVVHKSQLLIVNC